MVIEDRHVKWKRRRGGRSLGQHPVDEAKKLATLTLVGTFGREAAWLSVPADVAFLLDRQCLGRKISSDVSTDGITIIPWVSNTGRGRAQIVRLSMIEMFFLVHGLRCLTLYQEADDDSGDGPKPGAHSPDALAMWAGGDTVEAVWQWREGSGAIPSALAGIVGPRLGSSADGAAAPAPKGWGCRGDAPSSAAVASTSGAGGSAAADGTPAPQMYQMSHNEVWQACLAARADFPAVYSGYLFCRARGWLIRSGLQYGTDFVLYPRHPTMVHSSYSALVLSRLNGPLPADRALLPGQAAPEDRRGRTIAEWAPNWPELQGLSRLSVQVNKGMLLLYVEPSAEAASLPPVAKDSLEILERVAVTEVEATRFNPNRHREDWDPNE